MALQKLYLLSKFRRLLLTFIYINWLRKLIPLIQLKNIAELLCLHRISKEKHNINDDFTWTFRITKTFESLAIMASNHTVIQYACSARVWSNYISDRGGTYALSTVHFYHAANFFMRQVQNGTFRIYKIL